MRLIDADALMEAINTYPKFGVDERCRIVPWNERYEPYIRLRDAVIAITGMPTIEPERKKGKWLPDNNCFYEKRFVCSVCKESETVPTIGFTKYVPIWDYCPNCGADMRGEENETD